jgi:hypothetical protein
MSHPRNLTNLVYEFADETVLAAESDSALNGADVQESDADKVKQRKTLRVGSDTSIPQPAGGEYETRDFNGLLSIEFLVLPDSQKLTDRVSAREEAHQMAMEFVAALFAENGLNGRACEVYVESKQNGYRNIEARRYQASVINLVINADNG